MEPEKFPSAYGTSGGARYARESRLRRLRDAQIEKRAAAAEAAALARREGVAEHGSYAAYLTSLREKSQKARTALRAKSNDPTHRAAIRDEHRDALEKERDAKRQIYDLERRAREEFLNREPPTDAQAVAAPPIEEIVDDEIDDKKEEDELLGLADPPEPLMGPPAPKQAPTPERRRLTGFDNPILSSTLRIASPRIPNADFLRVASRSDLEWGTQAANQIREINAQTYRDEVARAISVAVERMKSPSFIPDPSVENHYSNNQ